MNRIIVILTITILYACEEKINLTLPDPSQHLVVEGRIEKVKDSDSPSHEITLSLLNNYFDSSQTPRVDNAIVNVRDGDGNVYGFNRVEENSGTYLNTTLVGQIGQIYTLTVQWEGEIYEAVETLIPVGAIDSAYQKYTEENTFDDPGIKLAIDFTDPVDQENFYFWELISNGESTIVATPGNQYNVIASDEFVDGQKILGYFPNEEKVFEAGDVAKIRHIGISSAMYDYLYLIMVRTGQGNTFGDTPPTIVRGNLRNLSNADHYALGYFAAVEVDEASVIIVEE